MQGVHDFRPGCPTPTVHPRRVVPPEVDAGEVSVWQALTLAFHAVEVIHGVHPEEGGGLLDVEVVGGEAGARGVHPGGHDVFYGRQLARVELVVHVHDVAELLVDRLCGSLCETLLVERHLRGAQLLSHEAVDRASLAVPLLLPRLEEELSGKVRVLRLHHELQHVDDAHKQGHAVMATPQLQLRLLLFHLFKEVHGRLVAVGAPLVQVKVELAEPLHQCVLVLEGTLLLSLLQHAALKKVPLDRWPVQP
mmetsp:Transcript_55395/g.124796  ORF Transcript_55395/g.124796 Transcript_55395/m.124796 type:complete len:250 (-) Transcript_55395:809-1558(-)